MWYRLFSVGDASSIGSMSAFRLDEKHRVIALDQLFGTGEHVPTAESVKQFKAAMGKPPARYIADHAGA